MSRMKSQTGALLKSPLKSHQAPSQLCTKNSYSTFGGNDLEVKSFIRMEKVRISRVIRETSCYVESAYEKEYLDSYT